MPSNCSDPLNQPHIFRFWYCSQNLLQPWNIFNINLYRKCFPSQHVAKREHVVLGQDNRHTFSIDGLNYSWASNFIPTRAKAELRLKHQSVVIKVLREVLMDLEFWISPLPVSEEDRPNWAVKPTSKEGEVLTWGSGLR
uniref:Uncharacterized protein n=1 Tax=Opuntia streptacantha TaxID=393608 RepID=A0A7C9E544_OPUST